MAQRQQVFSRHDPEDTFYVFPTPAELVASTVFAAGLLYMFYSGFRLIRGSGFKGIKSPRCHYCLMKAREKQWYYSLPNAQNQRLL